MSFNKHKSRKAILKRFVEKTISLSVEHWFSLKNLDYIPDHSYAFYQTLKLRFGIEPRNNAEVKFIRKVFHDVYINKFHGKYKLDLEATFTSPLESIIGAKKLSYYRNHVSHTKNVSIKKRLKQIQLKNKLK